MCVCGKHRMCVRVSVHAFLDVLVYECEACVCLCVRVHMCVSVATHTTHSLDIHYSQQEEVTVFIIIVKHHSVSNH